MSSSRRPRMVPASRTAFLSRHEFPEDFVFGFSSSAFQYEEAEGRGPSIWDTFLIDNYPDLVEKDKALEGVHHIERFSEDVEIMKEMGIDSYRFSISWPRVLPNGRRTRGRNGEEQGVSKSGIKFYNKLINELIRKNIEPVVCLFHWDLPQTLEDEYKGFMDDKVVDDFCDYADLCFREFGDRVKKWITFNETWTYSIGGYLMGTTAPGRGVKSRNERSYFHEILPSSWATSRRATSLINRVKETSSDVEPYKEIYIVTHNQILAHAFAVKLYRENYQKSQKGEIGIILVSMWAVPYDNTDDNDEKAALRAIDFMLGWVLDPLVYGDYPKSMIKRLRRGPLEQQRLPKFGDAAKYVKDSFDFIGLNYYTSNYAANYASNRENIIYNLDSEVKCYTKKDGVPIGEKGGSDWLYVYPSGIKKLLLHIKEEYNNPPIYITENGIDEVNDKNLTMWKAFYDFPRISYHYRHLLAIKEAISQGANVRGYFAWSLLDNLEGAQGFATRFGINYVDFTYNYERFPKLSAAWFKFLLQSDPES